MSIVRSCLAVARIGLVVKVGIVNRFTLAQLNGSEIYPLAASFENLGCQVLLCQLTETGPLIDNDLDFNACLWRASETLADRAIPYLRFCHQRGITTINSDKAISFAANKWTTHYLLTEAGISSLPTSLVSAGEAIPSSASARVLKPVGGAGGVAVRLIEAGSSDMAYEPSVIQPFAGKDIGRIFLAGGRLLGSMRRRQEPGQLADNYEQGGHPEWWSAPEEAIDLAVQAAAALGVYLAGVDLVYFNGSWSCLEVNSSPGYRGFVDLLGPEIHEHVALACLEYFQEAIS